MVADLPPERGHARSGTTRTGYREPAATAAARQTRPTMEQWQFDDAPRGWKPYGGAEQQALAAARAAGQRSVALVTGRWSYRIDLGAMTQTNAQTGTVRPVRAVPNGPMPADEPEVDDDLAAAIAASLADSLGDECCGRSGQGCDDFEVQLFHQYIF
jgi:hypothetical protein